MRRLILPFLAIMAISAPALADDTRLNDDRIIFGVGRFDFEDGQAYQRLKEFRIEYRAPSLGFWHVHPWMGIESAQHNTGWGGAGLETDIGLTDWLVLTLQTGAGYYTDGDFQHTDSSQFTPKSGFQFRHQVELAYRTHNDWRIGVGLSHMSNGGIGPNGNPAVQSLDINLHIPFNAIRAGRTSAPVE